MSLRVTFLFIAFFSALLSVFASPVDLSNGTSTDLDLEKRLTRVGRGTWFHPGHGNCGKWDNDNSMIFAMGKQFYDRNQGTNCGQWAEIVNVANGKKAYGMLRDSCYSCEDKDIDLSPALFKKLDKLDRGVLKLSWHFMAKGWHP